MQEIKCEECGKNKSITNSDYKKSKSGKHFCSRNCRATYYNKLKRHVTEERTKNAVCLDCGIVIVVSKHCNESAYRCDVCKPKHNLQIKSEYKNLLFEKKCKECERVIMATRETDYCTECRDKLRAVSGRKSAAIQAEFRRSKNEIMLSEMLAEIYGNENILTNPSMFIDEDGYKWDADIVLPKFKLAIHWNGNWHHKKITEKHSVAQVQARDKIKYSVIEMNGFKNYIIDDFGKENENKVKEEFILLQEYINNQKDYD